MITPTNIIRVLGKTEAWYVVAAEPQAEVAVGFKETITAQRMEESARSGEIEDLLDWRPVKPGTPSLCPLEQFTPLVRVRRFAKFSRILISRIVLYDYGRPRELHLEHGVKVSDLGPHHYRVNRCRLAQGGKKLWCAIISASKN